MSLSLHTNFAQMLTQNNVNKSNEMMSSAMQRLSTGFRINSASDDAAGLQIANRMEAQSRGMAVAQRNAQDGVSLLQTAEGAINELNDIGLRMKDLASQSANGTNSQAERDALDGEFQDLKSEFQSIVESTSYGGAKIFDDGGAGKLESSIDLQIGTGSSDQLTLDFSKNVDSLKEVYSASSGNKLVTVNDIYIDTDGTTTTTEAFIGANTDITDMVERDDATGDWKITVNGTTVDFVAADGTTESNTYATAGGSGGASSAIGTDFAVVAGDSKIDAATGTWDDVSLSDLSGFTTAGFDSNGKLLTGSLGAINTSAGAQSSIDDVNSVLESLSNFSSDIGSKVNRLGHTMSNLANQETNIDTARGRVMDADFATESANLTKYQMLMQAGTTMLSRTGQTSQMAMSLLR